MIAVTRAMGDHNMKRVGYVRNEINFTMHELLPTDDYLILACDGVYSFVFYFFYNLFTLYFSFLLSCILLIIPPVLLQVSIKKDIIPTQNVRISTRLI
jgi:hypothetical protein